MSGVLPLSESSASKPCASGIAGLEEQAAASPEPMEQLERKHHC